MAFYSYLFDAIYLFFDSIPAVTAANQTATLENAQIPNYARKKLKFYANAEGSRKISLAMSLEKITSVILTVMMYAYRKNWKKKK